VRIIAGTQRGRRLLGPPDEKVTRPITDMVKESIFNILRGHVEGQAIVDAFAGTGSMGLEAISRGASSVLCIEQNRQIADILKENIDILGFAESCAVLQADVLGSAALAQCPEGVRIVFFDPPYSLMHDEARRERVLEQLGRFVHKLDDEGYAVLRTPFPLRSQNREERDINADVSLAVPGAIGPESHRYGSMSVHLYMRAKES
jgi:16S rRNA (guanine966-N2)-methyltransferase